MRLLLRHPHFATTPTVYLFQRPRLRPVLSAAATRQSSIHSEAPRTIPPPPSRSTSRAGKQNGQEHLSELARLTAESAAMVGVGGSPPQLHPRSLEAPTATVCLHQYCLPPQPAMPGPRRMTPHNAWRLCGVLTQNDVIEEAELQHKAESLPPDLRSYLQPVGVMETRYVRLLSSLCSQTYVMNKMSVRGCVRREAAFEGGSSTRFDARL